MALSCSLCFGLATLISIITAVPVNRQVGLSSNVYMDLRNDTKGQGQQSVCMIDDVLYQDGDTVPTLSPCELCVCRPPGFACTLVTCEAKPGCRALQRSNQCCPEYRCECERNGRVYQNGEKLENPDTPCEVCYCQSGEVVCTVIECYKRDDCEARYVSGRCCPKYDHCPPIDFHPERPAPVSFRPLSSSTHPVEILHNVTSSTTLSTTDFSIMDTTLSYDEASDHVKTEISKLTTSQETSTSHFAMLEDKNTTEDTTTEATVHKDIFTESITVHTTEELSTIQPVVLGDEPYDNENSASIMTTEKQVLKVEEEDSTERDDSTEEDDSAEIEQTTKASDDSNETDESLTDSSESAKQTYNTEKSVIKETVQPEELSEVTTLEVETDKKQTGDDSEKDEYSTASSSAATPIEKSEIEATSESNISSIEPSESDENTTDISLRNMPLSDSPQPDMSNEINDQTENGSGWNQSSEVEDLPAISTSHDNIKSTESILPFQADENMKSGSSSEGSSSEESTEGSGFQPSMQNIKQEAIFNPSTIDSYEASGFDSSTYSNRATFSNPSAVTNVNEGSGFDSSTHDDFEGSGFSYIYNGENSDLSTTERILGDELHDKNSIYVTTQSSVLFKSESSIKELTSVTSSNNENDNSFQNTGPTTDDTAYTHNILKENIDDDNFSGDGILADDSKLTEVYSERVTDHTIDYKISADTTVNILQRNALSNSETLAENTNGGKTISDGDTTVISIYDINTSEIPSTVTSLEELYETKFNNEEDTAKPDYGILKANSGVQNEDIIDSVTREENEMLGDSGIPIPSNSLPILNLQQSQMTPLIEDISTNNPEITTASTDSAELKILPDINELKPNKSNIVTGGSISVKNESDSTEIVLPEEWLKQNEQIAEKDEDNLSTTDSSSDMMTEYTVKDKSASEESADLNYETSTNNNEDSTQVFQTRMGLEDIDDKTDFISEASDTLSEVTGTDEFLVSTDNIQKFQESDKTTSNNSNEEIENATAWIISKNGYTESDDKYTEFLSTVMPTTGFLLLKDSNANLHDEMLQDDAQGYISEPVQQFHKTSSIYEITTITEKVDDITTENTPQENTANITTNNTEIPEVLQITPDEPKESLQNNKTEESNAIKQLLPDEVKTSAEINFYTTSVSDSSASDKQQQTTVETSESNINTEDSITSETVSKIPDSSKDNSLVNLEREDTEKIVALLQNLFRNPARDR